jgi:3-hydroxyisobutyrate dehydrogenase-like beta-hydroxyacid dehydrogenase
MHPDFEGDFSLIDSESQSTRDVSLTSYEIERYQERLAEHTEELAQAAKKYDAVFLRVSTDEPVESLILQSLRKAGIVA